MTGTSAACLHTNQSRSYLNHLVFRASRAPFRPACVQLEQGVRLASNVSA